MRKIMIAVFILTSVATSFAASWKSEGPYFGNVLWIEVDRANPDHLFVSTHAGGIWQSVDGGKSWTLTSDELTGYIVPWVMIQPKSTILWIGLETTPTGSLGRSKDNGKTWEWMRDDLSIKPNPLTFDPTNPKAIWVADVNLHKRTIDGGAKWTEFRVSGGDVVTFEMHPTDPKTIWAGGTNGGSGLSRSTDGGASWQRQGKGLPEMNGVRNLIADPSDPNILYMTTRRDTGYRSENGGESWAPLGGGFPSGSDDIECFVMDPSAPKTLYAGTEKALLKTTDGGKTWNEIESGLPPYIVSAIAVHPASSDVLWAGLSSAGLYKSTDGGKSWKAINSGFAAAWIERVWADASGTVFAQTGRGLYRREAKGEWAEIRAPFSTTDKATIDSLVFDSKNPKTLHAGDGWSYFRSTDGGASWSEVSKPFQDPSPGFDSIVPDAKNPKVLYSADDDADNPGETIFKSVDGGAKWKPAGKGITAKGILILLGDSSGMLAGLAKDGSLWKSVDGAITWTRNGDGLPSDDLKGFALDPTNAARMYVASKEGFYRSEDGGATFTAANEGIEEKDLDGVAVDAAGRVYIANSDGVFRSTDGGATWKAFNEGLTNTNVQSLSVAGTRLYVGTGGGGVFSIDLD